jgi:hypothetical protein
MHFNRWGRVVIAGSLLTEFYLREGLRETPEWRALDAAQVAQEADAMRALWQALADGEASH